MSAYSEWILFAVNLVVNHFLLGLFIAGSVAVSFRLIKNASSRLRYVVAVAAFLFAAFFPLIVTLNGSTGLETFFEAKQNGGVNAFDNNWDNQNSFGTPKLISPAPNFESEKISFDLLNNFTSLVAGSFIGIVLFSMWILVSVCFLLRDILAHRNLRKARQFWRTATKSERKELAFPDGVPLYFGEESPVTLGLFCPIIVFPTNFPDELSLASKRYIVQHELAHAGWRDPLVNSLLRLIRSLFWISPALWILERIAAAERESAADYAAITKFSADKSEFEATALNYATTLVSVAKHFNSFTGSNSFNPNTIGLSDGSILESRIRRLLAHSSEPARLRVCLASIIFAGCLTGLFFMPVAFQPKEIESRTEAAVINNQKSEKLPDNENLSDLPTASQRNKPPQFVEDSKNKERSANAFASKQDGNKQEKFSTGAKEIVEIPRVIIQSAKQTETLKDDVGGGNEDLMRKLAEEDAKNRELRQKIDELSDNLKSLDDSRRNPGNDFMKMRQKTASDLDSRTRQTKPVINSNQNIN